MVSEGSRLVSGGPELAARQLKLCQAKLAALVGKRAEIKCSMKLLMKEERLIMARQLFWEKEAELQDMKSNCGQLDEKERPPPEKKRRRRDAVDSVQERVRLVKKEVASAQREQRAAKATKHAHARRYVALSAEIRDTEAAVEEKDRERRTFAREHYRVAAQRVPHEMLRAIFSYLSPNDRLTAGQVCSLWREVVKTDCSLWRDLRLSAPICAHDGNGTWSHDASCRVMAVVPYVDEVRVCSKYEFREDLKIRKLILAAYSNPNGKSVLVFYRKMLKNLNALSVERLNFGLAGIIDTHCKALKELLFLYRGSKTYIFAKNFVTESTLVNLSCCNVPYLTLESILKGHCDTLLNISLTWVLPYLEDGYETIRLTDCARLMCFQVDCRVPFVLPPSCSEVQLVLKDTKECATRCEGCVSLTGSSITRLSLICDSVFAEAIEWHLRWLGEGWLARLEKVSVFFCAPLSDEMREKLVDLAGRSLDFPGRGSALTDWHIM